MREPLVQIYTHLVWATWNRLPLLTEELRPFVYSCIQSECGDLKTEVLALGGIADHIHLLVRMPSTISLATLVKQIKGASSHLVTQRLLPGEFFKWQGSYGAFSVSKLELPRMVDYIRHQEQHHRNHSIIAEYEWEEN